MRRSFARRQKLGVIDVVGFAVAFAIRAWWALRVQRPIDAVWSEMAGYVLRAELLLKGEMPGEPRMLALWPSGDACDRRGRARALRSEVRRRDRAVPRCRRIEERRLESVGVGARVERMIDNVLLLAVRTAPWPEEEHTTPMRQRLQRTYARVLLVVLAFALLGLAPLRRHPTGALLVTAQLATIVLASALYLGEARYRVPYDPLLIVVGVVGLWSALRFAGKRLGAGARSA